MQQPLVEFASKVFSELSRGVRTIVSTERRIGKNTFLETWILRGISFTSSLLQAVTKLRLQKTSAETPKTLSRVRVYFCFYREKGKKKKTFLKSKPVREKSSRKFLGGSKLRILFLKI
jgi:hypothetical protein